jgi:hypothetical protein
MLFPNFLNPVKNIIEKVQPLLPCSSKLDDVPIIIEEDGNNSRNQKQVIKRPCSDILSTLKEKDYSCALLFFAVIVRILFNKATKNGRCSSLAAVTYYLRDYLKSSSKTIQEALKKYSKKDIHFIINMSIIIFFCQFFGKTMEQFLDDINENAAYTLILRLRSSAPIYAQRISEFKTKLGKTLIEAIMLDMKEYLYSSLALYELNDSIIEFVALGVSLNVTISKIYNQYGFSKFLNFAFWHGLFAQIEACIPRKRHQKKYRISDLLFTYLTKLVEHGDNMDDLEKELKNSIEQDKQIINPCAQSFRDLLADLEAEELKTVQKQLARRVSRRSLKNGLIVSADWTLVPVRGHHKGAYKCWDHVTNKEVMAYKLHVLYNSTDKQPLAFMFEEKDQTPTQVLKALIEETRQLLAVNRLGLVLYDKGYYNVENMKQLGFTEQLVTPGKKFSAIKEAIKNLSTKDFVGYDKDKNMLYDTNVHFKNADLTLRLVVARTYKEQYVKTKSGSKKLVNGHYVKEREVRFHSYLTNIPKHTLSARQVIDTYAKRWSIEHFFKELNNYGLKVLPSTDYKIVQNHVTMVLLMYMLVTLFKKALGGTFSVCSLKTLNKIFFRASICRIQKEHPNLLRTFIDEGNKGFLLDYLIQDQKFLLTV